MKKPEPIEKIRKRYKKEWLLIAVTEANERKSLPLKGQLVAHSPRQDDIYATMLKRRGGDDYMVFSEDGPPAGYALAL